MPPQIFRIVVPEAQSQSGVPGSRPSYGFLGRAVGGGIPFTRRYEAGVE